MRHTLSRWFLAALVAIGMIAHGHAVVRHHGAMIGSIAPLSAWTNSAPSELAALQWDLQQAICQPGGRSDAPPKGGHAPRTDCPICQGLAGSFVLASPLHWLAPAMVWTSAALSPANTPPPAPSPPIRPQSRGPPATVA